MEIIWSNLLFKAGSARGCWSSWVLSISRDGYSKTFPVLHHPYTKVFLMFKLLSLHFCWCPMPLVLSRGALEKVLAVFSNLPHGLDPLSLLFLWYSNPSALSFSLFLRSFGPSAILMALQWIHCSVFVLLGSTAL